ncbi:MAG: aquaporin [Clostridia bacterium]|nr:aquaporin [Clostridia bacterium]
MKKYLTEFVGTYLLVIFGCGTACIFGMTGGGAILSALAFGLTYMAAFYCFGTISGCHLNPAISIAQLLMRKLSFIDCVGYIAAQIVGGIAGSAVLYGIIANSSLSDVTGRFAANSATGLGGFWVALIIESILSFAFALTYIRVTEKNEYKAVTGGVTGLALTLCVILGSGVTGASVNPARSLGPALFAGGDALRDLWIFIAAPIVGALVAAIFTLFLERRTVKSRA